MDLRVEFPQERINVPFIFIKQIIVAYKASILFCSYFTFYGGCFCCQKMSQLTKVKTCEAFNLEQYIYCNSGCYRQWANMICAFSLSFCR